MTNARRLFDDLARQLAAQEEATRPVPAPSPPGEHRRLCLGMSTYDDFDGVYFTVQAVRLFHAELLDQMSFLVVDNHPEGVAASALRALADVIPDLRYVPFRGYRSTAVRDLVFREADADIVVCVDSHVLLQAGGLRAVVTYFDDHPGSLDLVQGPLFYDTLDRHGMGTHFDPTWGAGMYGQWGHDDRAAAPSQAPFEIGMQGLGVFACRRDAWPGINPRFRGFGGEEGYLHEKIRQRGGKVVCLPALGWAHRFARPNGAPYSPSWVDRARNYLIGWSEVGWDTAAIEDHFLDYLGAGALDATVGEARRQLASPFTFFDAIFCLNLDDERDRWSDMMTRFETLDVAWRVERFPAIATPGRPHLGCLMSFRAMIAEARQRAYDNVLIIEDDAVFLDDTVAVMARAIDDLAGRPWDLLYLGGCAWAQSFPFADGSTVLQRPSGLTCTHAIAFNRSAYDRFLDEVPESEGPWLESFYADYRAVDQYLPRRIEEGAYTAFVTSPRVASQPALVRYPDADLDLAARYVI